MKITRTETEIRVASPYNSDLPARAKRLGGRWDPSEKFWRYDIRTEERVADLYRSIYGEWDDGTGAEKVSIRCTVGSVVESSYCESLQLAGRVVARALGRDSGAKLGEGVIVERGGFSSSGSRKNWYTTAKAGTVFVVYDVPKGLAEELVNYPDWCDSVEIVGEAKFDREVLITEREKLVARMAEIDELLK